MFILELLLMGFHTLNIVYHNIVYFTEIVYSINFTCTYNLIFIKVYNEHCAIHITMK